MKHLQTNNFKKISKIDVDRVRIDVSVPKGKILSETIKRINTNTRIKTMWKVMNVNAIDRMGMTDHGPTHFKIVANNALSMSRLFEENKVKFSAVSYFGLTVDHAETIIFLASVMHDLGMSIHREGHEGYSLFLANDLLKTILSFLPEEESVIMASEVLHAIISHRRNGKPLTVEAGIVRIADALDMSKGRSRIPYNRGFLDIHSVSANAIKNVEIMKGKEKPVAIKIVMENPAGMFQIDDLMQEKVKGSGIEKYIEVRAYLLDREKENLFKQFIF